MIISVDMGGGKREQLPLKRTKDDLLKLCRPVEKIIERTTVVGEVYEWWFDWVVATG